MFVEAMKMTVLSAIASGLLLSASVRIMAADQRQQLAMHDMPMQSQGQMQMPPQGQRQMQPHGQRPMPMPQGGDIMDEHTRMLNDQMRMRGQIPGTTMVPGTVDLTDRLEGRLAYIRAELHITDSQSSVWNAFADGIRSSRRHLIEARQQLNQGFSKSPDRLEQYERHLALRLDAVKSARTAFSQLYSTLNDAQKHAADELVTPFITTF